MLRRFSRDNRILLLLLGELAVFEFYDNGILMRAGGINQVTKQFLSFSSFITDKPDERDAELSK